jgi:uncharacterized membrane protein YoaK (UPF0700 family)
MVAWRTPGWADGPLAHDRVVDRAAAHAPRPLLTLRDWLLVALAFSAGVFDAICFLSLGKVFTAFQTGNIVFLGLIVSGTRPPAGQQPVTVLVSLAAFAAGVALAMPILRSFNGDEEVDDKDVFQVWPRRVSIALGIGLVAQAVFLAVWMTTAPSLHVSWILVGLSAFAMGLQINAIRLLHVPGISTTAATATLVSLVAGISVRSLNLAGFRRLAGILVAIAAGAFLGDFLLSHGRAYAPLPAVLATAMVIAIATTALRSSPRRAVEVAQ